jgi:hypothetical protein
VHAWVWQEGAAALDLGRRWRCVGGDARRAGVQRRGTQGMEERCILATGGGAGLSGGDVGARVRGHRCAGGKGRRRSWCLVSSRGARADGVASGRATGRPGCSASWCRRCTGKGGVALGNNAEGLGWVL